MIKLKHYQEQTLQVLRQYLELARYNGAKAAYEAIQVQRYQSEPFKPFQPLKDLEGVPYACLRLPTGGGKTLLSAHTIRLAGESYTDRDYPLTLWLVPTNTIKMQTLETLKNPENPNYQVLRDTFNGRFRVFDIADFRQIRPQDIEDSACVIVSTFAALRVDNTEGRKVYSHDENLEPHFSKIPVHTERMERDDVSGNIKFSFANLLNWHQPLVIIDEAHNAKSELSIEVLRRVNAACVIEYTATPAQNSNVIHSVTAAELKTEEMIKLPVIFSEEASWEHAITKSIHMRQKLEDIANKDKDYIRPLVLFQAENKGQETTVEVIENYLIENENISRSQIAIATGDQRELDNINLFDPNCPIRYVITVQALKEGWDCSFAYVLCSVSHTKSATAIEQLLGRVLRMPYAKRRTQEDLNRAYVYVSSQSWSHATTKLYDYFKEMGFEKQEADEFIYAQPLMNETGEYSVAPFEVVLTKAPNELSLNEIPKETTVTVEQVHETIFRLKAIGYIDSQVIETIAHAATDKKDKIEIILKGNNYIKHQSRSPFERGDVFDIPQLCLNIEGSIELAETELCLDENGWNILDYYKPLTSNDFQFRENSQQHSVDLVNHKVQISSLQQSEQLNLAGIQTNMETFDLVMWLNKKLRAQDINHAQLLEYLRKTVRDLNARTDLDLAQLVRGRFALEKFLRDRINTARKEAFEKGYQTCMFSSKAITCVDSTRHRLQFKEYPTNRLYDGPMGFNKHFFPRVAYMNGEEADCAHIIDKHPHVEFWVRNLDGQPKHAFWLPTSTDKFYPDFVLKLNDGRFLVIEYKGAHLDNADTNEKNLNGHVWAKEAGALFLMAWKKDKDGRDIYHQIDRLLGR